MQTTQTPVQNSIPQTSREHLAEMWLLMRAADLILQIQNEMLPAAPDYVREQFARPSMVRKEIAARLALLACGIA
ncbi:MAG: hypothetical protein ACM359_01545 [Bacillota bacterium]